MYVTEITKDNLSYCKQLMKMTDELRHLDGIKGNFYINESGYLAPATYQNNADGREATFMFTLPVIAEVNDTYK